MTYGVKVAKVLLFIFVVEMKVTMNWGAYTIGLIKGNFHGIRLTFLVAIVDTILSGLFE